MGIYQFQHSNKNTIKMSVLLIPNGCDVGKYNIPKL
jgi:hypothetical protein